MQRFFDVLDRYADRVPLDVLRSELEALDITRHDLQPFVAFGDDGYQRKLMRETSGYQAFCLCWRGGQHSPIHDHAGSGCGLKVIEGEGAETVYQHGTDGRLHPSPARRAPRGMVCVSFDTDTHRFGNANDDADRPLITLHIYSPPMLDYRIFEDEQVAHPASRQLI
jgi:cysteine dioxygenase